MESRVKNKISQKQDREERQAQEEEGREKASQATASHLEGRGGERRDEMNYTKRFLRFGVQVAKSFRHYQVRRIPFEGQQSMI